MLKLKMINFVLILCVICIGSNAYAALINLNARTNGTSNPISEFFQAGTYDVLPIGKADGGAYNAWDAWNRGRGPWIHQYSLSSDEFEAFTVGSHTRYRTDLLALSNAQSTTFTLKTDGYVNFFISDTPYYDNGGGVSLQVNPVPIPGAVWLLGSGLVGLIGLKCKKNLKLE